MSITTADIRSKLASLDIAVADAERQFDVEAADAVGNVEGAGRRAAEIDQRLDRLATDRKILERALSRAEAAERAADEAIEEARRKVHVAEARDSYARLLDAARRADNVIADLARYLEEIAGLEGDVRRSLSLAKVPLHGSNAFQGRLVSLAVQHTTRIVDGRSRYTDQPRSLASAAHAGWNEVLEDAR